MPTSALRGWRTCVRDGTGRNIARRIPTVHLDQPFDFVENACWLNLDLLKPFARPMAAHRDGRREFKRIYGAWFK
jgi:hypothetical protein